MNAPFRLTGLAATEADDAGVATLRFDLRSGDIFELGGRTAQFERRLDGKLQFLQVADKDVIFLTDRKLAFMSASGDARFVAGSDSFGKPRGPLPSRLKLTKAQEAEADRKIDYIEACIRGCVGEAEAPEGWDLKRSKALEPLIAAVATGKGEPPPHFTTVLEWFDCWMTLFDIHGKACLVARHHLKGNRRGKFGHVGEVAIERGLWRWLSPNMTMQMAYAKVFASVQAYKRKLRRHLSDEELDAIEAPSLSTFERRCNKVDKYTRDYYRKGASYANRVHNAYDRQALSARPYQDVEVDHCTLDLLLVDDESDLVLGRPDLVLFRCRATGMIIGYGLDYEAPSYASFVAGLRHAMYPKDMGRFPAVQAPWPCFGRIQNLWVDNALHFIGDDIESAARELRMNKPRFKPRNPWLKGALERFFGFLNTGLIHLLPGTTLSNVVDRRNVDPETLDRAKIRVSDFEALLVFFICEVANSRVSKGLGTPRGVGDIPLRVWEEKARSNPIRPLPPVDLFIALCGEWETRTIQNDGITWDHITYSSDELITLIVNPGHRSAREGDEGTRYTCRRDPSDLGRIYVVDPYDRDGRIITVPACSAHRDYAEARHRHNHQVAVAEAKRTVGAALNFEALMHALDRLGEAAAAARGKPERKNINRRLARYLHRRRTDRLASQVRPGPVPIPTTVAAHLDPLTIARGRDRTAPVSVPHPRPALAPEEPEMRPHAEADPPLAPPRDPASDRMSDVVEPDGLDDLAELKSRKQWGSSDE